MSAIEQPEGPPLVEPVDPAAVDALRRRVYESYERHLRNWLRVLDAQRGLHWHRDYTSLAAYAQSVAPMRERFKRMLGFWVEPAGRRPVTPQEETLLLDTADVTVTRFVYEVLPGLITYALRLVPKSPGPHPGLLIQHGYLGTPELACGLTKTANAADGSYRSFGLRAARHGYHVIAPHHPSGYGTLSDAVDGPLPGHPGMTVHYGKNRLHRLCVMGGGSLLGLDMLASSRAVDLLLRDSRIVPDRVGVYGLSRGGQTALYLSAMDERLKASVCSAYFNHRLPKLIGPYSRTTYLDWFAEGQILPDQVRWFADADVVSLIAPRAFAIEAGLHDSAVDQNAAHEELRHAVAHYQKLGLPERIEFIPHDEGHVSATARAFGFLAEHLG